MVERIVIRELRGDDLDRIFSPPLRPAGKRWLEQQARSEVYVAVAELDGTPVGRVGLDFTRDVAEGLVYLWAAHVEPAFQSRGVGTSLMRHLEVVARDRGMGSIRLAVGKENPRAQRLYRRLGYSVVGEEIDQWSYVDGERVVHVEEACWTMEKRLSARAPHHPSRSRMRDA